MNAPIKSNLELTNELKALKLEYNSLMERYKNDMIESKRVADVNSARLRLLNFAENHSLDELLEETLNEAEDLTGSVIGFYHFVEEDQETLWLQNWSTRTKRDYCKAEGKGSHYNANLAGVWVDCLKTKKPVIHNDYASLPHKRGLPPGHAPLIRELVVPVLRNQKIVAILGIGNSPQEYNEKDVECISLLADLAWDITEKKRAEEMLFHRNIELDKRIYQLNCLYKISRHIVQTESSIEELFEDLIHFIPEGWYHSEIIGAKITYDQNTFCSPDLIETKHKISTDIKAFGEICGKIEVFLMKEKPMMTLKNFNEDSIELLDELSRQLGKMIEHKSFEKELLASKEIAVNNDRLKSEFLANMSHEIRTPMNGILGFTSLLKEPDVEKENVSKYLELIEKSGIRMLNIVSQMVDISKIEAGHMDVYVLECNIEEQLNYIKTFFLPEAEAKGLSISIKNNLHPEETKIYSDREKIYAILINLVKNAIKYSNQGIIEISCIRKGKDLEFKVRDEGIGIDANRQSEIFEPFIRVSNIKSKNIEGAGLGLAITKAYINILGGDIHVESEPGKGSCFTFTLPFNDNQPISKKENNECPKATKDFLSEKKLNFLIVEDEIVSDLLISTMIRDISNNIYHAKNGTEAIRIFHEHPEIDIILMDIRMPEMNGYETTRILREIDKDKIIIAQTAFALSGDREEALAAGFTDYLSKPIDKNLLMRILKKYIQQI